MHIGTGAYSKRGMSCQWMRMIEGASGVIIDLDRIMDRIMDRVNND